MNLCQKYKEITERTYNDIQKILPDLKFHSEDELRYQFRNKLEEFSKQINDERPIFLEEKRIDVLVRNIVVETKKSKELSGDKAIADAKDQTIGYMLTHLSPFGILTDLHKIYFFELESDKESRRLKVNELKVETNDFTYENFCIMLDILFGERKRFITEISLITDFGCITRNALIKNLLRKFYFLFKTSTNKKTKMIFHEWQKLFNLAETTNIEYLSMRREALEKYFNFEISKENEYQCLFIMHTVLSLIVKLLTFSFLFHSNRGIRGELADRNISQLKNFCEKIETGEIFRSFGVINLCNNDFFSWYIHEPWDTELFELLLALKNRSMLYRHIDVGNPLLLKDALQKLYENFIPREIRHSFGEYYTPPPVSDLMVQEAKTILLLEGKKYYRAIDPTCGSGTFLISLLKDKLQNNRENIPIRKIIQEVVGIDLNPIATLMAKFNYLFAVYNQFQIEKDLREIEIPVYLGDSSYIPTEENIEGVRCLVYEYYFPKALDMKFPKIVFPVDFVASENFLPTIIKIEEMITKGENTKRICNYLFEKIGEENLNEIVKRHLIILIEQVVAYQKENLNTIWLFIFMNYLKPFALPKFDLVIGNPPWVRWAVLPYEYKEKIKKSLRKEGIFSEDKNYGGVDLNVCALITHRVIENLSNSEGVFAFLLPYGVLVNKSYEGFRKFSFGYKKGIPVLILKPTKSFFGEEPVVVFLKIQSV